MKRCPACGLTNPRSALCCNCGYNFNAALGDTKNAGLVTRSELRRIKIMNGVMIALISPVVLMALLRFFGAPNGVNLGAFFGIFLAESPFIAAFLVCGAEVKDPQLKRALAANWVVGAVLVAGCVWVAMGVGIAAILSALFWAIPIAINIRALNAQLA